MSAPLNPQVAAIFAGTEAATSLDAPTLEEQRAGYVEVAERLGGDPEPVAEVLDLQAAGVPVRAYRPAEALDLEAAPALAWFHGGGWVVGDLPGADRVCRSLANGSGAVVVSVDYRLAPEHPFPAAVQDAVAVTGWLVDGEGAAMLGIDPGRVALAGDSAGGNLAAVAALHRRDAVAAQLLVYPVTDAAAGTPSWRVHADDVVLPASIMREMWATYVNGADALHADASPLRADLAGAPPAFVAVAGHDVLHDEGVAYAEALRAAGVAVTLRDFEDMPHGFVRWGGAVDRARELVAELAGFARRTLGDPGA